MQMVRRDSPVPIYHQIKQILLEELEAKDGEVPRESGRPLLTEDELIRRFHVSRAPVRQALRELVDEGYLYRERSKGTFPMPGPIRNASRRLGGLVSHLQQQGLAPRSVVSDVGRVRPPAAAARLLGTAPDGDVFAMSRLVLLDDEPLAWVRTYLDVPASFAPGIEELESAGTVFVILERDVGTVYRRGEQQIWATAAAPDDSRVLGIATGSPILVTETTVFANDGRACGWSHAVHRADLFKYVLMVTR